MVKIVTDSSCDLSLERCAELGVEMLPITVNFGEESYRANLDLTTEDFYQKLAAADELPHTAQITPAQFQEYFKPFVDSGDEVVCLFISSKMSGTLQSATVAKDILGATNIYLPDTLNVTFALGLLVEEAVKMRDRGPHRPPDRGGDPGPGAPGPAVGLHRRFEVSEDGRPALRQQRPGGQHPGHLPHHHLKRRPGGGGGQGPGQKRAAFKYIQGLVGKDPHLRRLRRVHRPCPPCRTPGDAFVDYMEDILKKRELYPMDIGSIVGTHTGPGAVGLAYIKK